MKSPADSGSIRLRRTRSKRHDPQILIAPLIDVVFLLVIFLVLVARFISPSIAVALPQSSTDSLYESRYVTVTIDAYGNAWLDNAPMPLEEITLELRERQSAGDFDIVRLRADRDTSLQTVIDALDAIRNAGIVDIAIETLRDEGAEAKSGNSD